MILYGIPDRQLFPVFADVSYDSYITASIVWSGGIFA